MTSELLAKIICGSPSSSGIYIFKNGGKNLYAGKAANLKARLHSYLKTDDSRIKKMLFLARSIEFRTTESDIEALILESQYIKKYKPAFNIMMRDDKQYGFVGFTEEKYPKLFITHQPHSKYRNIEISSFVGPFTDVGTLKTTLRYLRRIFPYCTCKQLHNNFCLNYHIGKCHGFCCLKNLNSKTSPQLFVNTQRSCHIGKYKKNIGAIKNILSGKRNSLLKNLEKEMIKFGKEERFEEAIELQNKIKKIKRVFENARIIKNQNFPYYNISNNYNEIALSGLKKVLGLKKIPARIEGYDVANIQGKYAVGAMAVFVNGKLDKSEYRKFKILTKQAPDDTAMLKEILIRRFRHPEWLTPDLIVVDGGKAQLNTAFKIVSTTIYRGSTLIDYGIIALAKNEKHRGEKIFVAGRAKPIPLSQLPLSVTNLLLQVDSEAHRFAIGYYRKLHSSRFC